MIKPLSMILPKNKKVNNVNSEQYLKYITGLTSWDISLGKDEDARACLELAEETGSTFNQIMNSLNI